MEETSTYGAPYYPSPNAPASQGKLFRDPKPTAEHRWPRGYNPERQREARAVTGGFEGDDVVNGVYAPEVGYKQREWANDVLARSSADLSAFHDTVPLREGKTYKRSKIENFEITDQEYDHPSYEDDSDDKGGFWNQRRRHLSVNRALVPNTPEQTLMHEMGHAHSTFTDPIGYRTNVEMGREEGRADVYMAKHWVPGKSTTERPRQYDYQPRDWQGQGEPEAFTKAYTEEHAAHGLPTPEVRAESRKSAREAADVASNQRRATREDAQLFTAYDYGTGRADYYGRDRFTAEPPKDPEDMADEAFGLGYMKSFDKDAFARLPLSEEGYIHTEGVPGKEIVLNRVQAGRVPRDWRSRSSRAL